MISMSDIIQTERAKPAPSLVPADDIPSLSDDECLARLAQAVEAHDSQSLEEVARLIGRLAVTIE
jgi:predicted transcriptional regulator